jgi:hypothetical protein
MMKREESPYRLLVEGRDDEHCVLQLMKRHDVDWDDPRAVLPRVHDCGGFDPLRASLGVSAKSYARLGIMVDANADIYHRWNQVRGELYKVDVTLPDLPAPGGVIVPGLQAGWKVGVWLMPDNQNRGQLEDFLGKLIPPNDRCWMHACEATRRAKELGAGFPEKILSKANVHAWLAWQESPGLPFGMAITAKYFAADSMEALECVDWFKRLFF